MKLLVISQHPTSPSSLIMEPSLVDLSAASLRDYSLIPSGTEVCHIINCVLANGMLSEISCGTSDKLL